MKIPMKITRTQLPLAAALACALAFTTAQAQFSLYIRVYWAEQSVLDGTWMPPQVLMVK
jgi:hypothetical protein